MIIVNKKDPSKNIEINNKIVIAPLAGYTNSAYRRIMKDFGAGLVYTEMISAKGLIFDNDKTWEYAEFKEEERPIAIQLFGGEISDLVAATKMICKEAKPDIIDLNMGCPVKKVLKQGAGSMLLQEPDKIYDIVKSVVEASNVPVSVKIRGGWDHSSINCVEVSKKIEEAGASLIAIHGRTKTDLYAGKCNLDYIKAVKEAVNIPVIGNGDIKTVEDAKYMLEYTGVDAVMIGRAALGNPWFIKELDNYFNNNDDLVNPSYYEKIAMIKYHFEELEKIKCEKIAVLEMRTLAGWYVKGIPNTKSFKLALTNVKTKKEFFDLLDKLIEDVE